MTWESIGGRSTFLPPFVNERFDGPPYWACTFTAGLLGANIAKLGILPATQAEILALAKASGDPDIKGGSQTSHLATAVRARYGLALRTEDVPDAEVQRRLATGWALIAGCWYGKLPTNYRRWSPGFTGGHRVLLAGWANGRTRLFDPMAVAGQTYAGEWIDWAAFRPAFWSDDQAWVLEGELMQQTITVLTAFEPPRQFAIPAGATIQAWTATGAGKKGTFLKGSQAAMDALVRIDQAPDPKLSPHGTFVRVANGVFAGQFIAVDALRNPDGSPLDVTAPVLSAEDEADIRLAAAREEWDRINAAAVAQATVQLPARP